MKKLISLFLFAAISFAAFAGCSSAPSSSTESSSAANSSGAAASQPAGELKTIKVGASPTPHAEILKEAQKALETKGYKLEIKEFSDYVIPNTALEEKSLDANYFQHKPYLDSFNQEKGTHLVSASAIHYEPFGIYAGKTASIEALADGAKVAVPNDPSNEARALLLLQDQGLIKLKDGADINATAKDIVENPKNLKLTEMEAAQLVRALPDVDIAVINGNYAIQGGLNVKDSLAQEKSDSLAATTYANIIAVREGDENSDGIKALIEVLKSEEIKKFINDKYAGAVVPAQ